MKFVLSTLTVLSVILTQGVDLCTAAQKEYISKRVIETGPQNIAVVAPQTPNVSLLCCVTDATTNNGSRIQWWEYGTRGTGNLISDDSLLLPKHPKYSRYQLVSTGKCFELTIFPVNVDDGTKYECFDLYADAPATTRRGSQLIVMKEYPLCANQVGLKDALEGESYTMSCTMDFGASYPISPRMTWTGPVLFDKDDFLGSSTVGSGIRYTANRTMNGQSFSMKVNFNSTGLGPGPEMATNVPTWNYTWVSDPVNVRCEYFVSLSLVVLENSSHEAKFPCKIGDGSHMELSSAHYDHGNISVGFYLDPVPMGSVSHFHLGRLLICGVPTVPDDDTDDAACSIAISSFACSARAARTIHGRPTNMTVTPAQPNYDIGTILTCNCDANPIANFSWAALEGPVVGRQWQGPNLELTLDMAGNNTLLCIAQNRINNVTQSNETAYPITVNYFNACTSRPCQNGGTCRTEGNGYNCLCIPGITGPNCETQINNCASAPCLNGGTCYNNLNSFFCVCEPEFSGPRCETPI